MTNSMPAQYDNENTKRVLNSIYNNAIMSGNSIATLNNYVDKESISTIMHTMATQFRSYEQRITDIAHKLKIELKQVNSIAQSMAKTSMKMQMLADDNASHAVRILVQGVNMGIIDMYKLLNNVSDVEESTLSVARDLLSYHEQSNEKLKQYL